MLKDTILQSDIEQLLDNLKNDLSLLNEQSEKEEFTNFELLLIGTLSPTSLRDNCNAIIRDIDIENIFFRDNTAEILSAMLSTPDPTTCYSAMKYIKNKERLFNINELLLYKALTLKEFLSSDLQSFQSDAVEFLTKLYPEREDWTVNQWKVYLEQKE
jgi:hypothetical protein